MKVWKHFATITKHRWLVFCGCVRIGLVWQGLTHDLSKYSPVEFFNGARYYQGDRSPNAAERREKGVSEAWIHHKGRNPHHYEYWTDMNQETGQYSPVPVPRKYLAEMIMDRRAACMTYQGDKYTDASPLAYHERSLEKNRMHPETRRQLEHILTILRDKGEKETFQYLRREVLAGNPFPWEKEENNA